MNEVNMLKKGLAHCQYHDAHWSYCWDYEGRLEYIKEHKSLKEQALRLKLLYLVPDEMLPGKDSLEWQAYWQVWKAWQTYEHKYAKELAELHEKLFPDCPWDGFTIFTRKNEKGEWY